MAGVRLQRQRRDKARKYIERFVTARPTCAARRRGETIMAKARQRTHNQVLEKMADLIDARHRIVEQRPFIVRETHPEHGQPVFEALATFVLAYADQTERDYASLVKAAKSGRIRVARSEAR